MENKFKTPKIDTQNIISFTCSDDSIEPLLELFGKLRSLGQMGSSREVSIDWDGDGRYRLENISVNGMTLDNWEREWKRLEDIRNNYKTQSEPQDEQNQLNRLHNIKHFQSRGECPFCEGYGELFDSSDLEEPHKDCHYCGGSGDWETTETPEELHKKYPFLG